jgi:hypothetical protein
VLLRHEISHNQEIGKAFEIVPNLERFRESDNDSRANTDG